MIDTTAQALLTDTFQLAGILAEDELMSAATAASGLRLLNALVDGWGTARQTMLSVARYEFDLIANQQTYSMGVGGDFDLEPPLTVDHVGLLLPNTSPAVEKDLPLLTDDAYAALQIKTLDNALPEYAYYNRATAAIATLFVWPNPTQDLTIALYVPVTVTQFSNLTEEVTLAAGYYDALKYNACARIYPAWGIAPRDDVLMLARETLASIKRANFQLSDLAVDPALVGGGRRWNILTDTGA